MKQIIDIIAIALIVAAVLSVPILLGLHWWDYTLYGPLAGFAALVVMFGVAVYREPRP